MIYHLEATDEFKASLQRLDKPLRERVNKIVEKISSVPRISKPLHGHWDHYRVRFEGFRLLYAVVESEKKIILLEVEKRDVVYRH